MALLSVWENGDFLVYVLIKTLFSKFYVKVNLYLENPSRLACEWEERKKGRKKETNKKENRKGD